MMRRMVKYKIDEKKERYLAGDATRLYTLAFVEKLLTIHVVVWWG